MWKKNMVNHFLDFIYNVAKDMVNRLKIIQTIIDNYRYTPMGI